MAAMKNWLHRVETRMLVWLARGRASSYVIVGTMVAASLGAAALSTQPKVGSTTVPMSAYGCMHDPDSDGHIFCDGSVAMFKLPASYGQCHLAQYGPVPIICRGTGW